MAGKGFRSNNGFMLLKTNSMENEFCNGMSMIMAMGGFQWSLFSKGDCITYFAPNWKLNSAGKFQGAMVYSFLLAMLTEGITSFQAWIRRFLKGKLRKVVMAILYAVQQWLGYIIMLVAMTYSLELLGCILLGLMTGRWLFPNAKQERRDAARAATSQVQTEVAAGQAQGEETPLLDSSSTMRRRRG